MEQAAEALLLSVCSQSTTSRMASMALFERRLRRAYEGVML